MEEIKINIDDGTSDSELIKPKATRKPRAKKVTAKKTLDEQEQWALDQIKETKRLEQEVLISRRIQEALDDDRKKRPVEKAEVVKEKKTKKKKEPEPEPESSESEEESEDESESDEESSESEPELTKKQLKAIRLQLEKKQQKKIQKKKIKRKQIVIESDSDDSDSDDDESDDERPTIARSKQFNITDHFF